VPVSTPIALGIGPAWLAPVEHLRLNWAGAADWLPGLVVSSLANGGTTATPAHALIVDFGYAIPALAVGGVSFARRDISI
jgi:hypothetical protein